MDEFELFAFFLKLERLELKREMKIIILLRSEIILFIMLLLKAYTFGASFRFRAEQPFSYTSRGNENVTSFILEWTNN